MIRRILLKMQNKLKMKQKRLLQRSIKLWLLFLGVFLFSSGCFLLLKFDYLYDLVVNGALHFAPNSKAFTAWQTNDPPLIMDLYFFNWTNADQIHQHDVKPNFEQVGPYRFKEVKEKTNITVFPNDTVEYSYAKYYYFMEDESPRKMTDVINSVNPVALTAGNKFKDENYFVKKGISFSLATLSKVIVTTSIEELLFKGFEESFLRTFQFVTNTDERFGWFYQRNATVVPDKYMMHTENDENFGKLMTWNYKNTTDFFGSPCNEIKGSAGEFYPLNQKRDYITLYSSEMCSYVKLDYIEDVNIKGIHAYKYAPLHIFDNGHHNPETKCFCRGDCIPSGVLDIGACRRDSPIFLSLPHFYGADPHYTTNIEGMKPEKDLHEFYITLEPKSGIAVDVAARMQINMRMQPISAITILEELPDIYVPIFFIDQVVTASDELAVNVQLIQMLPDISHKIAVSFIVLGGLLTLIASILMIYSRSPTKREQKTPRIILTTVPDEMPLNAIKA